MQTKIRLLVVISKFSFFLQKKVIQSRENSSFHAKLNNIEGEKNEWETDIIDSKSLLWSRCNIQEVTGDHYFERDVQRNEPK